MSLSQNQLLTDQGTLCNKVQILLHVQNPRNICQKYDSLVCAWACGTGFLRMNRELISMIFKNTEITYIAKGKDQVKVK